MILVGHVGGRPCLFQLGVDGELEREMLIVADDPTVSVRITDMAADDEGGLLLVGYCVVSGSSRGLWLKLDAHWNVEWQGSRVGGPCFSAVARSDGWLVRTVSRLMDRQRKPPSQTWRTFLDTASPTAEWTAQQVVEAFPWDEAPRFLMWDRDSIYGDAFRRRVKGLGIEEVISAPRSPWQNPFAERVIGTLRRELTDHVVVLDEQHLLRLLNEYVAYYNASRTHLSLEKDALFGREVQGPGLGAVVAIPQVGGLHRRYERRAA